MTTTRTIPHCSRAAGAGGFTLVEMALVLLIVGLLAAVFLPATNTMLENSRRKETRTKLEALEQAMARFVMVNRRLPCPADGTLPPGNANQGRELVGGGGACNPPTQINGVVPWRSLGVSQGDASDAWNTLITYRVWAGPAVPPAEALTLTNGMDMSTQDPTVVNAVSNWLVNRGFRVCNVVNCPAGAELASKTGSNGVAYVLISHGANRIGGFNAEGNYVAVANGLGPGPLENINFNAVAVRTGLGVDFYIDADFAENPAAYYDDIVLRPTVISVALAAGLGPRH